MLEFNLPIKTISEANRRTDWGKSRFVHLHRHRNQRGVAELAMNTHLREVPAGRPLRITLVRIGPRRLDDDNLAGAMKHVRDGIADSLKIDDGDETQAVWAVAQEKGRAWEYSVRVRIEHETGGSDDKGKR
jgi:hypothetical protein